MRAPAVQLTIGALPAVAAGFFVLAISGVGRSVWLVQAASVVLMLLVATGVAMVPRVLARPVARYAAALGVALCAVPLLAGGEAPERWLTLGPLLLYIAPVVIPAGFVVAAEARRLGPRQAMAASVASWTLAYVLAAQPDLSQVVALTAGASVLVLVDRAPGATGGWGLLPLAVAIGLAAAQPDPLAPVSYVEEVLAVSWRHSVPSGIGVSAAALVLLWTLTVRLSHVHAALPAVGAYYAALFAFSIAGLTPAPLIGFGAGPLLGFGLLVGVTAQLPAVRGSVADVLGSSSSAPDGR